MSNPSRVTEDLKNGIQPRRMASQSSTQVSVPLRYASIQALIDSGDILEVQDGNHGNDHPKSADYVDDGVPFIMAKDIQGGRLNTIDCVFITRRQADRLRIGFAKPGDILLSHKGTVGAVALVPEGYDYVMLTPQVTYYRVNKDGCVDRYYLAQVFQGPEFQARIARLSNQSTRNYIGITEQKRLTIPVRSLSEQRKIAKILRTWDEAIEKLDAICNAKNQRFFSVTQRLLAPSRAIGRNIPKSNWELATLGEVFEERQDRNEGLGPDDVVTVGKYAIRKQSEHFSRSVASKDQSNYWTISPGDFVYDPMSAYYGALGRYDGPRDGIVKSCV